MLSLFLMPLRAVALYSWKTGDYNSIKLKKTFTETLPWERYHSSYYVRWLRAHFYCHRNSESSSKYTFISRIQNSFLQMSPFELEGRESLSLNKGNLAMSEASKSRLLWFRPL